MEKLTINYDTFQRWKYRKVNIDYKTYLQEIVAVERCVPQLTRESGSLYKVAKAYHKCLEALENDAYFKYLKKRKIHTIDDFYSYLHAFYTRYRESDFGRENKLDVFNMKKTKKKVDESNILAKTSRPFRRLIYRQMMQLDTVDPALIMRKTMEVIDQDPRNLLYENKIITTSDFLRVIEYVINHTDEFEMKGRG